MFVILNGYFDTSSNIEGMELVVDYASEGSTLHWHTEGEGQDVVLVHGWGMNGAVWHQVVEQLRSQFRVHVVDLPGYGFSHLQSADSLEQITQQVLEQAPRKAVWVGWSLGGLISSHIAATEPDRVQGLITVASSPKFAADRPWRGIQPKVLDTFTSQLLLDFKVTVERFMALQAMGSPTAKTDVKLLKRAILTRPEPNKDALLLGLQMLAEVDLRHLMQDVSVPMLRLYGRLDGLVPVKVAQDMQSLAPHSEQHIFAQSSHAPFMTELDEFCRQLSSFARSCFIETAD